MYLGILTDLSLDAADMSQLHIVPGRIELHHKPFTLIEDLRRSNNSYFRPANECGQCVSQSDVLAS